MKLYQGTTREFVRDTVQNKIADLMRYAFREYYHHDVPDSEYAAWTNSLQFVENLITQYEIDDNMMVLEYELPYTTQRIDCIFFGKAHDGDRNMVVIELKQWSEVSASDVEGNVVTFIGGAERMVPHPSLQVEGYHMLLQDFVEAFETPPRLNLSSCVYCHNYSRTIQNELFADRFKPILERFPVYAKEDFKEIGEFLKSRLSAGEGLEVFNRFMPSPLRPSKKLLGHVSRMIEGQKAFSLVNEQITANNTIIDRVKKSARSKRKTVIVVRGGPGTGKSVIALNAVAELARIGKKVWHATGSKAFTNTVRRIVGRKASALFQYFNTFQPARVQEDELDALICDEAHRLRESSNNRYTRREYRSDMPQIDELIRVARVSVFFIDDQQVVRPGEIGSTKLIKEAASRWDAEVFEFELISQFRCSGSDGYLDWIDNILGIRENPKRVLTKEDKMDFRIFASPTELHNAIMAKNKEKANSARLVAGFCWPWSDPNPDGTLVEDIVIEDFAMPWEGRDNKKLARGIPKWFEWAYKPEGVNQVGCIYTAQGFEFDYIGIIFGTDLVYDPHSHTWIGKRENSCDPVLRRAKDDFTDYAKNIYRVLLTRGMKGCYVYFLDRGTEQLFRNRIEDF